MKNSERMLSTLVSHIPGVVYRCKNDPDWTMEYLSDGIGELTGYPAEEFIHNRIRSFNSIIVPEDRAAAAAEIQKALSTQQSYIIEYRITMASGDRKWIVERGSWTSSGDRRRSCCAIAVRSTRNGLKITSLATATNRWPMS